MKKRIWYILIIAVLALQCKKERTQWSPEFAFPIATGELSIEDFINPDYLDNSGEVLTLNIQETFTPVNLDDLLDLGDTIIEQVYTPDLGIGPLPFSNSTNIFSTEEIFSFNLDNAELRLAIIESGTINFSFESDVDGYLDLEFLMPSVTLDGVPLTILAQTEPVTDSNLFEASFSFDVSGYEMDLTGQDGSERNTIYGELSVATSDSPEYTAQIYGSDQIVVKIQLENMIFNEVRGFFGNLTEELDEEIDLNIPAYSSGSVGIEDISLGIEIKNHLGVDAIIELNGLTAINNAENTSLELDHSILNNDINFTRAFEIGNSVIPDVESILFNTDNSNLAEFISITPTQINLEGIVEINPLGDISGGNDFYLRDYPLEVDVDLELPLCAAIDTLTFIDTLEVDASQLDDVSNLVLKLRYENLFELHGELELFFPEETESFGTLTIQPAPSQTESVSAVSEITLTTEDLENLKNSDAIIIQARVMTENAEPIKIQSDHKIDILLTAVARYEASF